MMKVGFLTSRKANKHVILAFSVDFTARDTVKAKLTGVPSMFPCCIGLLLPSLARCQANAAELATKVCFLLIDVDLTQRIYIYIYGLTLCVKGKLCNLWCLRKLRLA